VLCLAAECSLLGGALAPGSVTGGSLVGRGPAVWLGELGCRSAVAVVEHSCFAAFKQLFKPSSDKGITISS